MMKNNRLLRVLTALAAFAIPAMPSLAGESSLRVWTDSNGRQIEARYAPELAGPDEEDVVALVSKSGKEIKVKLDRLSEADRNWVAGQKSPAVTPVVEPPKIQPTMAMPGGSGGHNAPLVRSSVTPTQKSVENDDPYPQTAPDASRSSTRENKRQRERLESLNPAFW